VTWVRACEWLGFGCVLAVSSACKQANPPAETAALHAAAGAPAAALSGECGLHTGYAGDEYCILPPPKDQGFQVHIGPSNYENPEPEYLLAPQAEVTSDFQAVSGNETPVFYYYRQFRMRPGTHHNIIATADTERDFGRRIAITNHLLEDNPKGGVLAPENRGVGIPLLPATPLVVSLHSINVTEKTALREVWVNFWYRNPSEVTDVVGELAQAGDTTFAIEPHTERLLGPFQCQVTGSGRMLWFYGHRHANNVRFSAWRLRGQTRELFYEAYNWQDPLLLEYSSTVQNPVPDRARRAEGGHSGVLDLLPGDRLEWECQVVNQTDAVLRFTNQNYLGEMCIMDAEVVGANCVL
jgi:hypothetical protein